MGQVGSGWVRLGQVGSGWVRLGQVGSGCIKLGQDQVLYLSFLAVSSQYYLSVEYPSSIPLPTGDKREMLTYCVVYKFIYSSGLQLLTNMVCLGLTPIYIFGGGCLMHTDGGINSRPRTPESGHLLVDQRSSYIYRVINV